MMRHERQATDPLGAGDTVRAAAGADDVGHREMTFRQTWDGVSWHAPIGGNMSDCSNSRCEPYDACRLAIHFYGEEQPWLYPLALNGRVIKDVFVGGRHYVAERECEVKDVSADYGWLDERDPIYAFALSCGHAHDSLVDEPPKFCPTCGAKVVA